MASPSLPVSTNQMWVRGTAGVCAPSTTTRTRASRWSTACWTGPCSSWRWGQARAATTSRRRTVRRAAHRRSSGGSGAVCSNQSLSRTWWNSRTVGGGGDCEMIVIGCWIAPGISAVLFSTCQICLWCGGSRPWWHPPQTSPPPSPPCALWSG